ncbi:hypothetical protein AAMO2058_001561800 [Amorphochlora amoebiformis]
MFLCLAQDFHSSSCLSRPTLFAGIPTSSRIRCLTPIAHSKPQISFRRARKQDLEALIRIVEGEPLGTGWERGSLQGEIESESVVLAEGTEGEIVAFMVLWLVLDQLEIGNLFVSPRHRRKGVGGKLLDHIIKDGRTQGAKKIILEVRESNVAARNLYSRAGFGEAGRREKYYGGVEAAILMEVDLDP